MNMDEKQVDFGYQRIPAGEKTERVKGVFNQVASRYDIMNDLMSAGLHRVWKDRFVKQLRLPENARVLDLAGGTGDIGFRIRKVHNADVTISDINEAMLEEGRRRAIDLGLVHGLTFATANAEELPFEDNSFDACTIAFGIRNVTHRDKALKEIHRVLKAPGQFLCMEFCPVDTPVIGKLYDAYSFAVIPRVGGMVTGDKAAYQYFVESIREFPRPPVFAQMITDAGFASVRYDMLNLGVVAIHTGWKAP